MNDGEITVQKVVLGGYMLQYLSENRITNPCENVKANLIQGYVKLVLLSKVKVCNLLFGIIIRLYHFK